MVIFVFFQEEVDYFEGCLKLQNWLLNKLFHLIAEDIPAKQKSKHSKVHFFFLN